MKATSKHQAHSKQDEDDHDAHRIKQILIFNTVLYIFRVL